MNERFKLKSGWMAGGVVALSAVLLAGAFLLGSSAQASSSPAPDEPNIVLPIATLSTLQSDSIIPENENDAADEWQDVRVNGVRARWNGETWEYSSDSGKTWTDEAPDSVTTHEDGSLTLQQGESDLDFDAESWEQELDGWLQFTRK